MKRAAMIASSPGRAEKLSAPGLTRPLRGKSGSCSRARASPMFGSRSKSVGRSSSSLEPALAEGGEPSSPKVTCIGQVRIRKKNRNQSSSSTKNSPKSNRSDPSLRCRPLCKFFARRKKKKPCCCCCCRPDRFFFCWKSKQKEEETAAGEAPPPPPIAFVREIKEETESESEDEDEEDEETRVFVSSSSAGGVNDAPATTHSPPKNALLLMRCRSAPYNRSSALAMCRFPVSPMPGSESEEEEAKGEGIEERGRESCNLSSKEEEQEEEKESRCSSTSRQQSPAGLRRCKSEPAKKAERLMEVSYSKKLNGSGSRGGGLGMVPEVGRTPSPPPILRL